MSQTLNLTSSQVDDILRDTRLHREIADEYRLHRTTISRLKGGKIQYKKIPHIGKGGRMICPGCGETKYSVNNEYWVTCNCGWMGFYFEMLFVKVRSLRGALRDREE